MKQILRKQKYKQRPYKPLRKAIMAKSAIQLAISAAMSANRVYQLNLQNFNDKTEKSLAIFNEVVSSAKIVTRNAILLAKAKTINK